jgi:hypothetical protein
MGIVTRGRGRPLTLFVPGGEGDNLIHRMRYADLVAGTKIGFAYEQSGHFGPFASIRRQAERDAADVRAVAHEHQVTRAIGFSRGARAIVGALAEDASLGPAAGLGFRRSRFATIVRTDPVWRSPSANDRGHRAGPRAHRSSSW